MAEGCPPLHHVVERTNPLDTTLQKLLFVDALFQDVELWNPVKVAGFTESVSNRDDLEIQGPSMAIAIGLSMRAIKCTR